MFCFLVYVCSIFFSPLCCMSTVRSYLNIHSHKKQKLLKLREYLNSPPIVWGRPCNILLPFLTVVFLVILFALCPVSNVACVAELSIVDCLFCFRCRKQKRQSTMDNSATQATLDTGHRANKPSVCLVLSTHLCNRTDNA